MLKKVSVDAKGQWESSLPCHLFGKVNACFSRQWMLITKDLKAKLAEGFKGDDTNLEFIDFKFKL